MISNKKPHEKIAVTKSKIIVPAALVFILCAVWTAGLNTGLAQNESRIVTRIKNTSYSTPQPYFVDVENPGPAVTTLEVDRPVYVVKEIEVPREIPVMLKDWDSPEQLAEFLKSDDTDQRLILQANDNGSIELNGQCEDLALQLRDRAMATGRYLSVQVLNPKEYEKWYGVAVGSKVYHAICMARIGNEFWYIEPSNDKQWLALYLD
jgi:hypothetical protein